MARPRMNGMIVRKTFINLSVIRIIKQYNGIPEFKLGEVVVTRNSLRGANRREFSVLPKSL